MKTRRPGQRILAVLCAAVMLIGLLPVIPVAKAESADCSVAHGDHSGWTVLTAATAELSAGNYYLPADVKLDAAVVVTGKVHLCLDGHTLSGAAAPYFTVRAGAELTLCDCSSSKTGTVSGAGVSNTANTGLINVEKDGAFHLYGGTIRGHNTAKWGGAVRAAGTFIMNGGAIVDNTAARGGAVYLNGGKFYLKGGTIGAEGAGNTAQYGGAVYGDGAGYVLEISGGEICYNTAEKAGDTAATAGGSALYLNNTGNPVVISGGKIHHNKANYNTSVNCKDNVTIHSYGVVFHISGGEIRDNTTLDGATPATAVFLQYHASSPAEMHVSGKAVIKDRGVGAISTGCKMYVGQLKQGAYALFQKTPTVNDESVSVGVDAETSIPSYSYKASAIIADDFESGVLDANWKPSVGANLTADPAVSVVAGEAHTGEYALKIVDDYSGTSGQSQVMYTLNNTLDAGTELILTAYVKIESSNNKGSVIAQLISSSHAGKADLTNTTDWQKLTTIATTGTAATFNVWLASNSTQAGVAYYDDVTLQILTEKLAITYLEELLAAEVPNAAEVLSVLKTKALSLSNVDDGKIEAYISALKEAGTGLTKAVIQTCIDNPDAPVETILFEEDFESYTAGEVAINSYLIRDGLNLWMGAGTASHGPSVVTTQAHTGSKSIYVNDDLSNGSLQLRMNTNVILHGKPAGTEIITTVWHKAEDNTAGTSRGYIRMSLGSANSDAYVTSTGEWETLSVIGTTTTAGQSPRIWLVSNVADLSKTYYDDVIVQVLTEELALSYLEEKLRADVPSASLVLNVLTTKALNLSEVDKDQAEAYAATLKALRQSSAGALTKEQVQSCIASVNFDTLLKNLEKPEELVIGITGEIGIPLTLPAGVSAQWTGVSPANGKITVAGGKATVTQVPAKNQAAEQYALTLRLTCAGKSEDMEYPVKLVNDSELAAKLLEDTRKALASGNMVLGISSTGTVALPAGSDANGVTAAWTAIKTNPNNRLTLNDGVLSVGSLPSRRNSDEALVTLTITRGDFSAELEYTLVVYNPKEHQLVDIPNPGYEVLDENGYAKGWAPYASHTEFLYTEISSEVAHTGKYSLMIYDTQELQSMGARYPFASVPVEVGYDYEATAWVRGNGTGGGILYLYFFKNDVDSNKSYASTFGDFPVNEESWIQSNIRGTATAGSVYLNIMPYSNQKGYGTVYYDDIRVWKITKEGILAEIEDLLTAADSAHNTLYTRLDSPLLGVGTLAAANSERYLKDLSAKRAAKGSALTDAELTAAVAEINSAVLAENTNDVNSAIAELPAVIDMHLPGIIAVPSVSVEGVSLAWTSKSADTNNRVLLTGTSAKAMSLPASTEALETVTMVLTLSKGGVSKTATVSVKLHPFTENINALAEAAQKLDLSDYLNGQKPNRVTKDLSKLPSELGDGITVTWKALDTADTTKASKAMDDQGKVSRPAAEEPDSGVLLQAVLTRNGESYIREFYLLVSAAEVDEVRELGSWDKMFENALGSATAAPDGWLKTDLYVTTSPMVLTEYAAVTDEQVFSGSKALRLTTTEGITAQLRSVFDVSGREGFLYSLQAMVYTESAANPEITLSFWDNEGLLISSKTGKYLAGSDEAGIWKNISVFAVAPVGTSAVTATLTGNAGIAYFDDVRLWEYPTVTNASFDLGSLGWVTEGNVKDSKLQLNNQTAQSLSKPAIASLPYVLVANGTGTAKVTLRFLNDKSQHTDFTAQLGEALFAYAPVDAVQLQILINGTAQVDKVQLAFGGHGTTVRDGSFEESASGKVGTPWTLNHAEISANSGKAGAGITVQPGGSATSNAIPIYEGRDYLVSADVSGGGSLEIEYFTTGSTAGKVKRETVTAEGNGWQRVVLDCSQLTDNASGAVTVYLRVNLKANGTAAVFDNVQIQPVTTSVSNSSMENLNLGIAGSFPVHWQAFGPGIAYVANQSGEATEGIKSLGLSLFGLGQSGVRSSLIRSIIPGKEYEASVKAKGSGAELAIEFWDEALNLIHTVSKPINSADWTKVSVAGTVPAKAAYATVSVAGKAAGNVIFDEAALVPVVKEIHSNIQLLLDDYIIKSSSNVDRNFHEGQKYTTQGGVVEPVFSGAGSYAQIYGTVLYDSERAMYGEANGQPGIYRMWYQTTSYRVAYAESKDGINWVAPKLGLTDLDGSKDNNVLNEKGTANPVFSVFAVFKDEKEVDANKRFKMVTHNRIQSHSEGWYELWASPDGLTWEKVANIMQGQDVANVSYDPVNEVYVGTFKVSINTKRTHGIAISKDLINWTEPIRMFSIDTMQDSQNYLRADSYGNGTYALGDSYVGFDWRFLINEGAMGGIEDIALMFSRDLTEDWQRFFDANGKPPIAIALGESGTFDDGFIVTASTPITVGDETWLYYGGWDGDHGTGISRTAKIGLVKWRLNGFASMDFGKESGVLETSLFTYEGSGLHINANVKGSLRIELLDAEGNVLDTAAVTGDSVDHTVVWDKATSLASLQGQEIALRFTGTDAQLYSFQINDETPFASVTYAAADAVYLEQAVLPGSKLPQPAAPVKDGCTFIGWYNGDKKWDFENDTVTGDVELVAKFEINKYTVTMNGVEQTVEHGAKLTKPADPVKEGYTFVGWYVGDKAWDFESDTVTGDVELTAKWEVAQSGSGGSGSGSGDSGSGGSGDSGSGSDEPSKTEDRAMPMVFALLVLLSVCGLAVIVTGKKKLF